MRESLLCFLCVFSVCFASACGPRLSPRERYIRALDHRQAGQAKTYYDELIALAHDAPRSRAGRRARAILRGHDPVIQLALAGVVGSLLIPAISTMGGKGSQEEVRNGLRAILRAQRAYHAAHGTYCRTFNACELVPGETSRYLFFLGSGEVAGGGGVKDPEDLKVRAQRLLLHIGLQPGVHDDRFTAVAVGDADADPTLDVWLVETEGNLVHVLDDRAE